MSKHKKKQFIFKRDPRDISYVWFYEQRTQQYFKINIADQTIPTMTAWEFDLVKAKIKEKGLLAINQATILESYEELHEHIKTSVKNSKKARRDNQRLKNNAKEIKSDDNIVHANRVVIGENCQDMDNGFWDEEVEDFG